jgi:hypothetical protein
MRELERRHLARGEADTCGEYEAKNQGRIDHVSMQQWWVPFWVRAVTDSFEWTDYVRDKLLHAALADPEIAQVLEASYRLGGHEALRATVREQTPKMLGYEKEADGEVRARGSKSSGGRRAG